MDTKTKHKPIGQADVVKLMDLEMINDGDNDGLTALHHAVALKSLSLCQMLLERGANPDSCSKSGVSPFYLAVSIEDEEIVKMMMCYGADPHLDDNMGVTPFQLVIEKYWSDSTFQEEFIEYSFDNIKRDVNMTVLVNCMVHNPKAFRRIIELTDEVLYTNLELCQLQRFLEDIKFEDLELLFDTFPEIVQAEADFWGYEIFHMLLRELGMMSGATTIAMLRILNFFIEDDVICRIITGNQREKPVIGIFVDMYYELNLGENKVTELVMRLLTLGLAIFDHDVNVIYKRFGYGELFGYVLHMRIEAYKEFGDIPMLPKIIYNPKLGVEVYQKYTRSEEVLYFFAVPEWIKEEKYRRRHYSSNNLKKLPQVQMPSLLQLARDKFRQYFVERLQIENGVTFHTNLKQLQICDAFKDIISLKSPIYQSCEES